MDTGDGITIYLDDKNSEPKGTIYCPKDFENLLPCKIFQYAIKLAIYVFQEKMGR